MVPVLKYGSVGFCKEKNLNKNYTTNSTEFFFDINYKLEKDELEGYFSETQQSVLI